MIVSGLRGVGKTVLLLEFEGIAKDAGWTAPRPIEIKSDTDFRSELADAAYQALLQLSARQALGDRLKSFTGLLRGFKVGASSDGGVEFSFDPEAVSGSTGDLERDLMYLFEELGQTAREHETGVVFLVDEMQFLAREELEAVAAAMHRMSQTKLPVALVGAGLPQLPGLVGEAKSYAERLFAYPGLGPLSEDAARQALVAPAEARGVAWSDEALARIVERVGLLSRVHPGIRQGGMESRTGSPIRAHRRPGRRTARTRDNSTRSSSTCASRRPLTASGNTWPLWPTSARGHTAPLNCRASRPTPVLHLSPTRLPHQEGPHLQPRLRSSRLHGPQILAVHAPTLPAARGQARSINAGASLSASQPRRRLSE